jgi:YfiH family protein
VHPGWRDAFPWLIQGTTGRGTSENPFDLGLFSDASAPAAVLENWDRLRRTAGVSRAVHAHQVHGAEVRMHGDGEAGLHLAEACDGHVTTTPGVLLAVTTADCVPVFIVDAERRGVAMLHAGWRGAAQDVLEAGARLLMDRTGSHPGSLHVHLGPAICGMCYEVGPEVFTALGLPEPEGPTPVDLRRALADRTVALGVPAAQVTISGLCTLCERDALFSHRGGDRARQVGFLGIRP